MNNTADLENTSLMSELLERTRQLNEISDERDELYKRIERQTDWYQQRFNALRKWVESEVRPISEEACKRYYAICANGAPSPHESAEWQDTLHGLTLRAERAESSLSKAHAQLKAIGDLLERDDENTVANRVKTLIEKLTADRDDANRRCDSVLRMADYNAEHMERHLNGLIIERDVLRQERDLLKAELNSADDDILISERQMLQALSEEFNSGVEKMRTEAINAVVHLSHEDGPGLGSQRLENAIKALKVRPSTPRQVRVKKQ